MVKSGSDSIRNSSYLSVKISGVFVKPLNILFIYTLFFVLNKRELRKNNTTDPFSFQTWLLKIFYKHTLFHLYPQRHTQRFGASQCANKDCREEYLVGVGGAYERNWSHTECCKGIFLSQKQLGLMWLFCTKQHIFKKKKSSVLLFSQILRTIQQLLISTHKARLPRTQSARQPSRCFPHSWFLMLRGGRPESPPRQLLLCHSDKIPNRERDLFHHRFQVIIVGTEWLSLWRLESVAASCRNQALSYTSHAHFLMLSRPLQTLPSVKEKLFKTEACGR